MAAGDFRVFRLVLKLRRTSEVGGGTRQDGHEPKLPNFQYPEECGNGTRFVATRAPSGPGCNATASMQCSGQNVSGTTDRSCVVETGSRAAAVYLSRRVADGGIDSDFQLLDCCAHGNQQEIGNLQQLCARETRQYFRDGETGDVGGRGRER